MPLLATFPSFPELMCWVDRALCAHVGALLLQKLPVGCHDEISSRPAFSFHEKSRRIHPSLQGAAADPPCPTPKKEAAKRGDGSL